MTDIYTTIGLMSGTSLDGVDAALIRTDGDAAIEPLAFITIPYEDDLREDIRRCLGRREDTDGFIGRTEIAITRIHAATVDWLLSKTGLNPGEIDLIGFHGQTIAHDPTHGFTWQIGSGPMLARLTGIDVVNDFRRADVAAGGQGAPFLPLYHQARATALTQPLAILNIGGVGNVTFVTDHGEILAFDTGPGNALIDDWMKRHTGRGCDDNGLHARQGTVDQTALTKLLGHPYFKTKPPKSLDRDQWTADSVRSLSLTDGAATLTAFTVQAVRKSLDHLPKKPQRWLVTGGGRHNKFMMEQLQAALVAPVDPVESVGWDGDALEAEGFAWLAVRSLKGLPLSVPHTTGVPRPLTGGVLHRAPCKAA